MNTEISLHFSLKDYLAPYFQYNNKIWFTHEYIVQTRAEP